MSAFSRIAMFVFLMLSLSFLVSALPTPVSSGAKDLVARTGDIKAIAAVIADLKVKVNAQLAVILAVKVVAELGDVFVGLVVVIKAAIDALVGIGACADINLTVRAAIILDVVAIIVAIVKALLSLVVKFGLEAVLLVIVDLKVCIHDLLVQLDVCVAGIVVLILNLILDVKVVAFAKAHLDIFALI